MCKGKVDFTIKPHFDSTYCCGVTAFLIPKVTAYMPKATQVRQCNHFKGLILADPHFNRTVAVDVLLGAKVHAQIIEEGLRKHK